MDGIELMRERRPGKSDKQLTSGPGKLCQALNLDRSYNKADLLAEQVWIEAGKRKIAPLQIMSGARIGIDYAEEYKDKPWRFWIKDNPHVSRLR